MSHTKSNRYLKTENKKWPEIPVDVPPSQWPSESDGGPPRIRVLRSRDFLIQVFIENKQIRLSVNRTLLGKDGRWKDNISWDELQQIKGWCGYNDYEAVEIFPRDRDMVNVANMRHLWVLSNPLPFGWKDGNR